MFSQQNPLSLSLIIWLICWIFTHGDLNGFSETTPFLSKHLKSTLICFTFHFICSLLWHIHSSFINQLSSIFLHHFVFYSLHFVFFWHSLSFLQNIVQNLSNQSCKILLKHIRWEFVEWSVSQSIWLSEPSQTVSSFSLSCWRKFQKNENELLPFLPQISPHLTNFTKLSSLSYVSSHEIYNHNWKSEHKISHCNVVFNEFDKWCEVRDIEYCWFVSCTPRRTR